MRSVLLWLLASGVACVGAEPLRVKRVVAPDYPNLARFASLQGSVRVQLEIGQHGEVLSARASGADKLLTQAAEKNVLLWSFAPPPKSVSIPVRHTVLYVYKIEGKPVWDGPAPVVVLYLPDRVEITTRPLKPSIYGSPMNHRR